jgi:hypothetical protein
LASNQSLDHINYISEKKLEEVNEIKNIIEGFHSKTPNPLWSIRESYSSIEIAFIFNIFKYHFSIRKFGGSFHIMHLDGDMKHVPFTTWDDFFQRAKPLIAKAMQKHREDLECFDTEII